MHKIEPLGIYLIHCGRAAALGENEMARFAIAGLDRVFPISSNVFAIVATEAPIPIFVTDKIGVCAPIDFDLREKIRAIDLQRLKFAKDGARTIPEIRKDSGMIFARSLKEC